MGKVLRDQSLDAAAAEAIRDIRLWVREAILRKHKAPEVYALVSPPFRPDLTPEQATPYLSRVLNEWLPGEVARLLTTEDGFDGADDGGMPALAVAKALEGILRREHFTPASLELLFEAGCLSPKYAYPADIEILRDVILALLGRTAGPALPVLPAIVLAGGFADAAGRASLVLSEGGEQLHVPLDEAQAAEVLHHDPVRIESILVTMDGRWWKAASIQKGPETIIVYRPGERLRIDFTSEHARLVVPWTDTGAGPGAVHLPGEVALFGRKWRGRAWERSGGGVWLHLEFSGVLGLPETPGAQSPHSRHVRPASVEMGWSEVEHALATRLPDAIDRLHREELIPLAHALERLAGSFRQWAPSPGVVEQSLVSVRYLHGAVASEYGLIPWRVLPAPARTALLKRRRDAALAHLFVETFEEELRSTPISQPGAMEFLAY